MSQPTPYDRQFNFQNQQLLTPADPPPGDEMDAELNAIKLTLDELLTNLALIQRDDGALRNESVGRVTLHSDVDLGFGAPSVWAPNTNYVADFDTIFHESFFYKANTTHLSDPSPLGFANDIAKWTLIADFSASAVQGLGTMSTQNADNVVISGGAISGAAVSVATPDVAAKATPKSYVDAAAATVTAYVDAQIAALNSTLSGKLSASSGTWMLFRQTSAPVGWTKSVTLNDYALRVTTGSIGDGGVLGFATVFAKTDTDSRTLTIANMPSHDHNTLTDFGGSPHVHGFTAGFQGGGGASGAAGTECGNAASTTAGASAYLHQHQIPVQGGASGHSHGMDIRVKYLDVIMAQKD